ncbi:lycopene beta-cyclase CrtY [Sphingomonas jatrophae]|uniref:lycopene beta-cyclase CrtY n=1 Tax=Sphingomonas jatrophae TaxID=1166337 RepID=UPI001F620D99|nr:lycopene beta-cyclase CrtY [Sphingomonas jatrophae]
MAPGTSSCDVAIVGGGLAGGLIALALAARRPELSVTLIEAGATIGGNHIWSFFEGDVARDERNLLAPLVSHAWPGYDVAFPGHRRRLNQPYYSIRSERLDAAVRAALPEGRVHTGRRALAVSARAAVLEDGTRIEAGGVIDARGAASLSTLDLGWQKFVGEELLLAAPHGLDRPIVMDATVEQYDGYRFVYVLPFDERTLFVEDTYYSTSAELQPDLLAHRIQAYAAAKGWQVESVARRESGVLPVAMGGDFAAYWQSGGGSVAKAGVRAGLFHPTTGYSLPDAVRTAHLVASLKDLSGAALAAALHDHAASAWKERGFYRMLDRMLFRAAAPTQRYKVLERFYTLSPQLIARFYAGRSTKGDKLRVLAGKPPVPVLRAIAALREGRA